MHNEQLRILGRLRVWSPALAEDRQGCEELVGCGLARRAEPNRTSDDRSRWRYAITEQGRAMTESCSDLGAEGHPFAVVPKEALDVALARVEELEAGLRKLIDKAAPVLNGVGFVSRDAEHNRRVVEARGAMHDVRALLKEGER